MGKRHFNAEWLDRTDSNSHLLHYWCEKRMSSQQHVNFVKKT